MRFSMRRSVKHKFNAKPVVSDGMHFGSKLEYAYYRQLLLRQRAGEIVFFLRQVPLHLPGGVKFVVDFVEFHAIGDVRFIDTKGVETPLFVTKKKMVEELYPITIEVVKSKDMRRL